MKNKTITLPDLKSGETYAGIVIDDKGSMHHLNLLDGDADDAPHQEQLDWAKSIGGELPTRQEQALLYANCKAQFKRDRLKEWFDVATEIKDEQSNFF